MAKRFNILCLSGGGYLGLYTIAVLADLEKASGKPIAHSFDLMAGTSIGGIIALGLAAEVPVARMQTVFEKDGPKIFSKTPAPQSKFAVLRDLSRSLFSAKYKSELLRKTIAKLIGKNTTIGDLKHRVIVPSVNLTKGQPQVFKTPHLEAYKKDLKLNAVDVALATSAAPTYFPVAEIGNSLFADGGLYANSPDLLAIHEATYFLKNKEDTIHLLSIGTTTSQFSFSHALGKNLGSYEWMSEQRLVNVMISSQQLSVDYMTKHRLGDRYLRLDATQSKEQERYLALDVATDDAKKTILGLASATSQAYASNPILLDFLRYSAPKPTLYK
ncbi:MAG TPA: CBASS cGAMP-activated phospholipase [Aestuariivirga sp.]|nr:CBASS cGAMP-activated phospholipase [Aestuariivirga sp.]